MDLVSLFEQLKSVNKPGVFLLKSRGENSGYVYCSSNIPNALVRLLSSNLLFPEFDFEVLEIVTNLDIIRMRCQYFKDLYCSNGFKILNPNKSSNWKLRISVIDDPKRLDGTKGLFRVSIYSGAYKDLTVGGFNDYGDVELFCAQKYPSNKVYDIIKSSNELTREYLNVKS